MNDQQQAQLNRFVAQIAEMLYSGDFSGASALLQRADARDQAPGGRGPLPKELKLDEEQVEILAGMACTPAEMSALAGVARSSLAKRFVETPALLRAHARGAAELRMSAKRRLVFNALVLGSERALELLLRNLCGWSSSGDATTKQDLEVFEADEAAAAVSRTHESYSADMRESMVLWRETYGTTKAIEPADLVDEAAGATS